jgi:hypothetical protein
MAPPVDTRVHNTDEGTLRLPLFADLISLCIMGSRQDITQDSVDAWGRFTLFDQSFRAHLSADMAIGIARNLVFALWSTDNYLRFILGP